MISDRFTRAELKHLIAMQTDPSVSIFMPTHRTGREKRQDPIRLKNLLRDAEGQLAALGLRMPDAQAFLAPGLALLDDTLFWRHQADGLAVFLSAGLTRAYRVPLALDELVVVAPRFHVKRLLSLLTGDGRFYLLTLSQNHVALFEGSRDSLGEVDLKDIPTSLAEALRFDDPERQLQFHTGAPRANGRRAALFHGHGTGTDDAKSNLSRFFQQLDSGLRELLKDDTAPLILAGVDYLLPIYREANRRSNLLDDGIIRNPETLGTDELHARAWELIGPVFNAAQQEAAAAYRRLAGTGRTSRDVAEAAVAAYQGRVETLFAAAGVRRWGTFNPGTQQFDIHHDQQPGDEDLLDFGAVHALINGGTAYVLEPDRMPDGAPVAAVFRY